MNQNRSVGQNIRIVITILFSFIIY